MLHEIPCRDLGKCAQKVGGRVGGLVSVTEAAERSPPVAACGLAANSPHTRVRTKAPLSVHTHCRVQSHLRDAARPWQGKNFDFTGANFSGGQVSPDDADSRGWPEPP